MKYILIQRELDNADGMAIISPFTFSNTYNHVDMASAIIESLNKTYPNQKIEVISAGFFDTMSGETHGHSETLNLKSSEEDTFFLLFSDYNGIAPKREPLIYKTNEAGL